MRAQLRSVLKSFVESKENRRARSIWTNGSDIYSYGTCLLTHKDGRFILNRTKYSQTTTIYQNQLSVAFPNAVMVDNIRMGADWETLFNAADRKVA